MKKYLTFAILAALSGVSFAAQTLQFNTSAGRATGFADASGTPQTGLRWGLVVDVAGDGFDTELTSNPYDFFGSPTTATQLLKIGSTNTDDVFVPSANLSLDSSAFGASGGTGTFGNIAVTYTDGITAGMKFAFIWLNDGTAETPVVDKYGFFNVNAFNSLAVMPTDAGGTTNLGGIFSATNDPVRSANIGFGPAPEPSRVLFLGLGFAGICFRRRRA